MISQERPQMQVRRLRWQRVATAISLVLCCSCLTPSIAGAATTQTSLPPSVGSVHAAPRLLPASGGRVTVTAPVKRAAWCQLVLVAQPASSVAFSRGRSTGCRGGKFSAHLVVGANKSLSSETISFKLVATNAAGRAARTFRILVSGQAATATTATTTVPATTTTTTPFPPSTGLTALPSPFSSSRTTSYNWAGYYLSGVPYTAVRGTFTVPASSAKASCTTFLNESVSVGGADNSDLLLAGVKTSELNPNTGDCVSGQDYVVPFWGAPSGAGGPISDVVVAPGDTITVTIWQVNGTTWALSVEDVNNGQSYTTTAHYNVAASTVQWLVWAPTVKSACGQGEDPSSAGICELTPFSSPIVFSNLAVAGPLGTATGSVMEQNEDTATPGAIIASGFSVYYS